MRSALAGAARARATARRKAKRTSGACLCAAPAASLRRSTIPRGRPPLAEPPAARGWLVGVVARRAPPVPPAALLDASGNRDRRGPMPDNLAQRRRGIGAKGRRRRHRRRRRRPPSSAPGGRSRRGRHSRADPWPAGRRGTGATYHRGLSGGHSRRPGPAGDRRRGHRSPPAPPGHSPRTGETARRGPRPPPAAPRRPACRSGRRLGSPKVSGAAARSWLGRILGGVS